MKQLLQRYEHCIRNGPKGLFSRGDMSRIAEHIQDGVAGAELITSYQPETIIDIGSGGGVPGLSLAIAIPECRVHLVESQQWKAQFLTDTAKSLNLTPRVTVHALRAEEVVEVVGREEIDCGVARALARPEVVAEYLTPLIRVGGQLILWSTKEQAQDLSELQRISKLLGVAEPVIHPHHSPLRDNAVLIELQKITPCVPKLPRRIGVATRRPLC